MPRHTRSTEGLPPPALHTLSTLAFGLKTARIRRRISVRDMAERLFVSPRTVVRMERGDPKVGIGIVITAVWVLGLNRAFDSVFAIESDRSGLALDIERQPKRVASKRSRIKTPPPSDTDR